MPQIRPADDPILDDPIPAISEVPTIEVGTGSSLGDVVGGAIATSVVRLLRTDSAVRLGEDPESVHQARVATRRLRSDLRTFRELLDPRWSASLRDELRWLGRDLGAVRDAEVLLGRLLARAADLLEPDQEAAAPLLAELAPIRGDARARLLADMRSRRYRELLERLVAATAAPELVVDPGSPARENLRPLMRRPWSRLRSATRTLTASSPDEALHLVRIRAKHVRYAAEAVAPVFGKRARSFARAAAELQDVLGEHQDAVVAGAWLRGRASLQGPVAFAAGELAVLERQAAAAARNAWPDAWKALSRKRVRFWA